MEVLQSRDTLRKNVPLVGFPYDAHTPHASYASYAATPTRLSIQTTRTNKTSTTTVNSPHSSSRQAWIDVRPLSPTTPTSGTWKDIRPLALLSPSNVSIFSTDSKSSISRWGASLRKRLSRRHNDNNAIFNNGSRVAISGPMALSIPCDYDDNSPSTPGSEDLPTSLTHSRNSHDSDSGSDYTQSPPLTPATPNHTADSYFPAQPKSSTTSSHTRNSSSTANSFTHLVASPYAPTAYPDAPIVFANWSRTLAEKEDIVWVERQRYWEDVVDTTDRLGEMVAGLNLEVGGDAGKQAPGRVRRVRSEAAVMSSEKRIRKRGHRRTETV